MNTKLPHLNKIFLKGLITFFRGVNIGSDNIFLNRIFEPVIIDQNQLKKFKSFFGFKSDLPLCYLYLLAQRAQVSLMLDKKFTIAIPGLIHISNQLELLIPIAIDKELQLTADVNVASKKGSLLPIFNVEFYQNEILVAKCSSTYLAKRKSNSIKKDRVLPEPITQVQNKINLNLKSINAKKYSTISGDGNPIHTSSLVARLFGLKSTIIQGWYLVSKATALWENNTGKKSKKNNCEFLEAVHIPSEINCKHYENHIQIAKNDVTCVNIFINN